MEVLRREVESDGGRLPLPQIRTSKRRSIFSFSLRSFKRFKSTLRQVKESQDSKQYEHENIENYNSKYLVSILVASIGMFFANHNSFWIESGFKLSVRFVCHDYSRKERHATTPPPASPLCALVDKKTILKEILYDPPILGHLPKLSLLAISPQSNGFRPEDRPSVRTQ